MVINRKVPNQHTIGGIVFHPGNQFIEDAVFLKIKDTKSFKNQLNRNLMEIVVNPVAGKDKKEAPKKSLAETIVGLPEDKAIEIIKKTVDGVDLKEISKLDKRRKVVAAAEKQIEDRQQFMNGMAPKSSGNHPGPVDIGEFA